jgi:hypothetical protein
MLWFLVSPSSSKISFSNLIHSVQSLQSPSTMYHHHHRLPIPASTYRRPPPLIWPSRRPLSFPCRRHKPIVQQCLPTPCTISLPQPLQVPWALPYPRLVQMCTPGSIWTPMLPSPSIKPKGSWPPWMIVHGLPCYTTNSLCFSVSCRIYRIKATFVFVFLYNNLWFGGERGGLQRAMCLCGTFHSISGVIFMRI